MASLGEAVAVMNPHLRALARSRAVGSIMAMANQTYWLARAYGGTDKTTHGYLPHYRAHLGPQRLHVRRVLEIGVGGYASPHPGGSLKVWRDYFPRAQVNGVDIEPKTVHLGRRVAVHQADQSSAEHMGAIAMRCGPFDVIIDDGSHVGQHQWASFRTLFDHVTPGGWYVLEDLSTSYSPLFGGSSPAQVDTGIGLVRTLVDAVQIHDGTFVTYPGWGGPPETEFPAVSEVHIYPGIAFVRKVS